MIVVPSSFIEFMFLCLRYAMLLHSKYALYLGKRICSMTVDQHLWRISICSPCSSKNMLYYDDLWCIMLYLSPMQKYICFSSWQALHSLAPHGPPPHLGSSRSAHRPDSPTGQVVENGCIGRTWNLSMVKLVDDGKIKKEAVVWHQNSHQIIWFKSYEMPPSRTETNHHIPRVETTFKAGLKDMVGEMPHLEGDHLTSFHVYVFFSHSKSVVNAYKMVVNT